MDIILYEIAFEDAIVYVAYPEEEIYAEAVGVGYSTTEAMSDLGESFNRMIYSDNGVPILINSGS